MKACRPLARAEREGIWVYTFRGWFGCTHLEEGPVGYYPRNIEQSSSDELIMIFIVLEFFAERVDC